MTVAVLDDPVLKRVRKALDAMYGDRIERVVLYGSRARGDAREDSDYDIAVFLCDLTDYWAEADRLADMGTDILLDESAIVRAMPFPAGSWRKRTPLMHEIRNDGVIL